MAFTPCVVNNREQDMDQEDFNLDFDVSLADLSSDDESMMTPKRFKIEDSESRDNHLLDGLRSANTKRGTDRAVRIFQSWLAETGKMPIDWKTVTATSLDALLGDFWFQARTKNNEMYKSNSMHSMRHGINRHVKEMKRNFDVITSPEFSQSNINFKTQMKELKRTGKADTDRREPLTANDLLKCYAYFKSSIDTCATALQLKVWFDLTLHLLGRGRENLRSLTKEHFAVKTDSEGYRYVVQCLDEATQSHQDDDSSRQARMYEAPGHALCPVKSFERYVLLLNRTSSTFFQYPMPSISSTDACWYHSRPLGHNTLGKMMSTISTKANLSGRYTNYCLRGASVAILDQVNVAGQQVTTVHRSESSLKYHSQYRSEETKRLLSHTLNKNLGLNITDDETHSMEDAKAALLEVTDASDFNLPQIETTAVSTDQMISAHQEGLGGEEVKDIWNIRIKEEQLQDGEMADSLSVGSPLTTHILDTAKGCPAADVPVTVYIQEETGWHVIGQGRTNSDGRCPNLVTKERFVRATYKIHFDTKTYFQSLGIRGFYPYVEVVFEILQPDDHYHVPLLLSPYSYSTYRGS